jgi:cation:H+ antiporter
MIALILGLVLLVFGGEVLVRHSSAFAIKSQVPPLIVGLTVVSIGTSSPELFTSLQAVWDGSGGIAVGNVIGSNIANLGLALGLAALIRPMIVDRSVLRLDLPLMIIVTLLFGGLALDGVFSRLDGLVLLGSLAFYMWYQIKRAREIKKNTENSAETLTDTASHRSYVYLLTCMAAGCILLYFGSGAFIEGATEIAEYFKVSDLVIGVTVVAFGTSVPEIVASIAAATKGEGDLGIGSLVGSNIMNILLVLGGAAITSDIPVDASVMSNDFWWMLATAALLYPILKIGKNISRFEGSIYVACYVAYIYFALV